MRDEIDPSSANGASTSMIASQFMRVPETARSVLLATPGNGGTQGTCVLPFDMTREEETSHAEIMKLHLPDLLEECSPEAKEWKPLKVKKNTSSNTVHLWEKPVSRSALNTMPPSIAAPSKNCGEMLQYAVRSSTTVHAPLEVVLKTLDCSSITAHRSFTRIIYENHVADTSVLLNQQHHDAESLAVRWVAYRCSFPMTSDCDFCVMEYSKMNTEEEYGVAYNNNNNEEEGPAILHDQQQDATVLRDPQKQAPAAYKIIKSFETKYCPILEESHKLVRGFSPLSGLLFYRTNHCDTTDVVYFASLTYPKHSSTSFGSDRQFKAFQSLFQSVAQSVGRLQNAVDAHYMSLKLSNRSLKWIDDGERSECTVCYKRFHQLTRRKHHCRLCGEVICGSCSIFKDADLPTVGPTRLRICKPCDLTQAPPPAPPQPTSSVSSPSPVSNRVRAATTTTCTSSKPKTPMEGREGIEEDPLFRQTIPHERAFISFSMSSPISPSQYQLPISSPKPTERRYFANKNGLMMPSPKKTPNPLNFSLDMNMGKTQVTQQLPNSTSKLELKAKSQPISLTPTKDSEKSEDKRKKFEFLDRDSLRKAFQVVGPSATSHNQKPQQNQQELEQSQSQTNQSPRKKKLEKVEEYEDILLTLCEKASALLKCRYAAVSLYTNITRVTTELELKSYLKTQASQRLIKISNNLLCCDPILKSQRVLLVKDTTSSKSPYFSKTFKSFDYDFKEMPIVIGPQKARFYAGTPLIDSEQNVLGAICVFDSLVREEMPSQQVLDQLQGMVQFAVTSIEARETLGNSSNNSKSLTEGMRQTEPVFKFNSKNRRVEETSDKMGDEEEERRRTEVRSLPFLQDESMETYKQQMRRLVLQAQRTQIQLEDNACSMQEFQMTQT